MDAKEAKDFGLVDLVVPKHCLEDAGIEHVDKVCRVAPLAAQSIKRSMNAVRQLFRNALELAGKEIELLIPTEDFAEGMAAFVEKRRPQWKEDSLAFLSNFSEFSERRGWDSNPRGRTPTRSPGVRLTARQPRL